MSLSLQSDIGPVEIAQIVYDVFQAMLGVEVLSLEGDSSERSKDFTATVQFLGETKGTALLHCSADQARAFTFRMLGEEPTEINDDVRDVLRELANIIGGNLKSLISPGMALSLPKVSEGSDQEWHFPQPNETTTVAFTSEVGVFHVSLVRIHQGNQLIN